MIHQQPSKWFPHLISMSYHILLGIALFPLAGCGSSTSPEPSLSPDEQFKKITDAKKARLEAFLQAKGSALTAYKAEVNEQTDINERVNYPWKGTIRFDYAVTKPEGEANIRFVHKAVAVYDYSKQSNQWIYRFINNEGNTDYPPPQTQIVKFAEVQTAFEQK
ncbi:MAG: hypothetical protein ACK4RK_15760 [Gemmataceae bacterium]